MLDIRSARTGFPKGVRPFLTAGFMVALFVLASVAGAAKVKTSTCGSLTFNEAADQSVTYLGIKATGVSCSAAKKLLAKAGKNDAPTPAGWTFGDTVANTSICGFSYKRGTEKVVFHTVNNGEGC
ncbi:MAG TPA: hypothetical protein VH063_04655 [Gaiellaceae bacterium]|jgi:hypothetical protein|nr:hypothetical protein [Gaiellaceae bacterium]